MEVQPILRDDWCDHNVVSYSKAFQFILCKMHGILPKIEDDTDILLLYFHKDVANTYLAKNNWLF